MNGPEWVLNPGPTDYQPSVLSTRPRRHDWKLCSFFMFLYLLYTNGSRSWEKMYVFQIHFGFTNLGSQVHSFWVIAIWIRKFWSWTLSNFYSKKPNITFKKRCVDTKYKAISAVSFCRMCRFNVPCDRYNAV